MSDNTTTKPVPNRVPRILKYGTVQHNLTVEDSIKGGSQCTPQKSIAQKLRKYGDLSLNCGNCKTRCYLYDAESTECSKRDIMLSLRAMAKSKDPEAMFLELFDTLSEMKACIAAAEAQADVKLKYAMLKSYCEKVTEVFRLKYPSFETPIGRPKMDLSQFHEGMRKAREYLELEKSKPVPEVPDNITEGDDDDS